MAHGDAWGRPPRALLLDALPDKLKMNAMVFDATQITDVASLRSVYEFFHPLVSSLGKCGRVVVIGRPPELARSPEVAAAQAALDGFVRSLGKELGKRGSTANLIIVDEGAEALLEGPLRFVLSKRSAFISGQPLHVTTQTLDDDLIAQFDPLFERPLEGQGRAGHRSRARHRAGDRQAARRRGRARGLSRSPGR